MLEKSSTRTAGFLFLWDWKCWKRLRIRCFAGKRHEKWHERRPISNGVVDSENAYGFSIRCFDVEDMKIPHRYRHTDLSFAQIRDVIFYVHIRKVHIWVNCREFDMVVQVNLCSNPFELPPIFLIGNLLRINVEVINEKTEEKKLKVWFVIPILCYHKKL